MPKHTFILNGKTVTVDVEDDVRLLWVIRDILGVTGPKYGCGINVCKACTSHINGKAFNPCSVRSPTSRRPTRSPRSRAWPTPSTRDLHPMQEAWLEYDVAQCGYCQPGQIMAAVAKVRQARAEGHEITDADLDEIRNVCRCGTYAASARRSRQGAAETCERGRARGHGRRGADAPAPSAARHSGRRGHARRHVHSAAWPAQEIRGTPSRRRPPDARPRPPRPRTPGRLWRLRRLGPGGGRREAHLLRPLRAAAPRPGVGRHRGQQRPPDPRLQGHGPGLAGLRRVHPRGAQGPPRDRSLALLHDRRQHLEQRPADLPARPPTDPSRWATTAT